ncbi:MAG: hypothetical protein V1798_10230 [Pseudomonadota bacterium]
MDRRRTTLLFAFFALIYILTNSFRESVQLPDEEYVLLVTSNLVAGRSLALPQSVPKYAGASRTGTDGKTYSVYQIGQSLAYAPVYFAAKNTLAFAEPYDQAKYGKREAYDTWLERQTRRFLLLCPVFFAALSCAIFFLFALRLGFSGEGSLILTLFYGLGTMVWPYSKFLMTESLQNCLLLGTVYLLFAQKAAGGMKLRSMLGAGAYFGFLLSIRASLVVLLPALVFYWFYRNRDRRMALPIAAFVIPMILLFIPQLVYDQARFGGVFATGYAATLFSTPLYVGLFGYLFSPGKSFFVYAPIALLFFWGIRSFFQRARAEAFLFCLLLGLVPLKYASWWVWSGDPSWGPRYLLILTPFLMLPAGEVLERIIVEAKVLKRGLVGALFAGSVLVQLLAVSVHYLHYLNYVRRASTLAPPSAAAPASGTSGGISPLRDPYVETEFNPEFSPVLGQWWMVKTLLTGDRNPALSAPWAGLGYAPLHAQVPLNAEWDVWVLQLLAGGFDWLNIKPLLGALALLIFWTIVAQELFLTILKRPPS